MIKSRRAVCRMGLISHVARGRLDRLIYRTSVCLLTEPPQSRFGIPYMHCGCPLPVRPPSKESVRSNHSARTTQGTTIGQRLSKLTAFVLSRPQRMGPPIDREDCYSATHPSDHNSIFIDSSLGKQRREVRELKWKRRRDRDGQRIAKAKGKANDKDLQERHARGQDHDAAFMVPVPLTYGYGYPWVYPPYPGLCAGVSSH